MTFTKASDNKYVDDESGRTVFARDGQSPESVIEEAALVPPPTALDARLEAKRRIIEFVSSRDASQLVVVQINNIYEQIKLLRKDTLTASEEARAVELEDFNLEILAIRVASNDLGESPPVDFADDKYWPE